MIELISAQVRNFRQLRGVELSFARSAGRHLTVVRAENGTGKTTLMTALKWGLFGDDALSDARRTRASSSRSSYRIHPLDWEVESDRKMCPVMVTIEFATIDSGTGIENAYRLVRSTDVDASQKSAPYIIYSDLKIYAKKPAGDAPIPNPQAFISNRILPTSLKDVFFTDGDRALAFIEATDPSDSQSAKRERVEQAVRQLLGIEILEKTQHHLTVTRQRAVKAAGKDAQNSSIKDLAKQEEKLNQRLRKKEKEKEKVEDDLKATEKRKLEAATALHRALKAGGADRRKLESDMSRQEKALKGEGERYRELVDLQRQLINSSNALTCVAANRMSHAGKLLEQLESDGVIPDTLPEVIRDRLNRNTCVCGRDVSKGTEGHAKLSELLGRVKVLNASQGVLLHLSSTATRLHDRHARGDDEPDSWSKRAEDSMQDIVRCRLQEKHLEKTVKELHTRIRDIPEQNIKVLEDTLTQADDDLKKLNTDSGKVRERLQATRRGLDRIKKQRRSAQSRQDKHRRHLAEETAAEDMLNTVQKAIRGLQDKAVEEVSTRMSEIFLKMIVADPDTAKSINRVELTRHHDIIVSAADGQRLDPDKDLSGAQRRALTLAFIFALAQVSGVSAPNVVDTPLGMTSHLLRRAILEYAVENSKQLVLFLTSSEIHGAEDILDRYAGCTYTLTFSDHYPEQLVNDPGVGRLETLLCECGHRSSCRLCQRKETG